MNDEKVSQAGNQQKQAASWGGRAHLAACFCGYLALFKLLSL
jgi:hypothetical protein